MMEEDNDPLSAALTSRRIPHGRSRNKQGGGRGKGKGKGGNNVVFDPLRTLGHYEIQLGSSSKRAQRQMEAGGPSSSWLEIHELTEDEDGLLGTFSVGGEESGISGICAFAGGRKGLQKIVDQMERVDEEGDEEGEDVDDNAEEEEQDEEEKTEMERSDEKLNRRINTFEKNSFRNPKFWMRWKGHVQAIPVNESQSSETQVQGTAQNTVESNLGYIVFASNDCEKFEGTINCSALGWNDLKMLGRKTRAKGTPCPTSWMEIQS